MIGSSNKPCTPENLTHYSNILNDDGEYNIEMDLLSI